VPSMWIVFTRSSADTRGVPPAKEIR